MGYRGHLRREGPGLDLREAAEEIVLALALSEEIGLRGREPAAERGLGEPVLSRVCNQILGRLPRGAHGVRARLDPEGDLVIVNHHLVRLGIHPSPVQPEKVHRFLFTDRLGELPRL